MKYQLLLSACVTSIIFSSINCGNKEETKKVDLNKVINTQAKTAPRLKIGLIPEQDIRRMASRYEPLAEYISKKLNLKVTLVYLDNYGEICDKFIYKQLDAAFFGSFSYTLTRVKAGIEPIARPDYSGSSTYRGLIIVREDSGIRNINDMKNKRLAMVHRATYAGYLYPLYYFKEQGINDLQTFFSKISFVNSHDKAIFSVLRNETDVAATKDLVYQNIIKENPDLAQKIRILFISAPVPSNTLCVRNDLDPALKTALKDILLNLHNDIKANPALESLGAAKFIKTDDHDYSILYGIIKNLNIDLNVYPYYKNDFEPAQ